MAQRNTPVSLVKSKYSFKSKMFDPKEYERPGLSAEQILEIKQAFDLFDPDNVGTVEPRELKSAINSLGTDFKNQEVYQIINQLEQSASGPINFNQFLNLMTAGIQDYTDQENIRKIFNMFDQEKKGSISIHNLKKIAKEIGQTIDDNGLQNMISKGDLEGKGFVTMQEFFDLMTNK